LKEQLEGERVVNSLPYGPKPLRGDNPTSKPLKRYVAVTSLKDTVQG